MKYLLYIYTIFLINCKEKTDQINTNDITKIVHESNKVVNHITENYYVLDERFKSTGRHSLMMTSNDISMIKKKIIKDEIYKLTDFVEFVKSCKNKACLSEITIHYKSGRKQNFIFDNYNYKTKFGSKSYKKIASLEELIAQIIMKKKIDPEPKNVYQ